MNNACERGSSRGACSEPGLRSNVSINDALCADFEERDPCHSTELIAQLAELEEILRSESVDLKSTAVAQAVAAPVIGRLRTSARIVMAAFLALVMQPAEAWPARCPLDLLAMTSEWVEAGRDGARYSVPEDAVLARFAEVFAAFDDAPLGAADQRLEAHGLAQCRGEVQSGVGPEIDVIYDPLGNDPATATGLPLVALRRGVDAPGVLMSVPHAATEWMVARQAVEVLAMQPRARAVLIGTVHRCRLKEMAPEEFQGATSECGGAFRASDQAHTQSSYFHEAHEVLWRRHPMDITVQIHGMSSDGISVSAGTSMDLFEYPNRSALRLHEAYAEALEASGLAPDTLTSCSIHDGPRGQRHRKLLCGTVNAQLAGLVSLGRGREFVHVEQSRLVRDTEVPRQSLAPALQPLIEWIFADGAER